MATTATTHRKRRIQSTNKLFPEHLNPNDPDTHFDIRWAPNEFRHASTGGVSSTDSFGPNQEVFLSEQCVSNGSFGTNPLVADGILPKLEQQHLQSMQADMGSGPSCSYSRDKLDHMKLNARGFQASLDMFEMWGDRPPQTSAKAKAGSSWPGVNTEQHSPVSNYRFGCDVDLSGHFSFKPDLAIGTSLADEGDASMAMWEAELFCSYRKMKYYGEEQLSREKTKDIVTKFTTAARTAYNKLESAALSDATSLEFKQFFYSLNGFETLTRSGFTNLDELFDGRTLDSLPAIYSFLHVAYAMSQTTTCRSDKPSLEDFKRDLVNWRQCLPVGHNNYGYSERHVFDELMVVMRMEIEEALLWIKERTDFNNFTNLIDQENIDDDAEFCFLEPDTEDFACDVMAPPPLDLYAGLHVPAIRPSSSHQMAKPPEAEQQKPAWATLINGPFFAHVIDFLDNLSGLGTIFHLLTGLPNFPLRGQYKKRFCSLTIRQQWQESKEQFQSHIELNVVRPTLQLGYSWLLPVFKAAGNLVSLGAIETLRDYENYVAGLSMVHENPIQERQQFMRRFLTFCLKTASRPDFFICRRKWTSQPNYTPHYVISKLQNTTMPTGISPRGSIIAREFDRQTFDTTDTDSLSGDVKHLPKDEMNYLMDVTGENTLWFPKLEPSTTPELQPTAFSASQSPNSFSSLTCSASPPPSQETHSSRSSSTSSDASSHLARRAQRRRPAGGRKFICDVPGCGAEICGSKYTMSNSNLLRHKRSAHPGTIGNQEYLCDIPGCRARYCGARGKENLRTHMRLKHGEATKR